jgi:uncharacterized protein YjbI with pentapeptide repeats
MGEVFSELDVATLITIITFGAGIIVYYVQKSKEYSDLFLKCASQLNSQNESDQIAGAVLMRAFIKRRKYREKALLLISSFLQSLPNGNLQKILADSLSMCKSAKGHDFQSCNMYNALIKPSYYIRYELTKVSFFKRLRLNFKAADFFEANLVQFNAKSVNFKGAVFYRALLRDAIFTNCILKDANFQESDLSGTRFKECNLEGADFRNARRISEASVFYEKEGRYVPLINFLTEKGVFSSVPEMDKVRYIVEEAKKSIFVSRLGLMDSQQELYYNNILNYISDKFKVNFVSLDRTAYRKYGQLSMIHDNMSKCSGVIVFAFSHLSVAEGVICKNLKEPYKQEIKDCSYSSSWLQIETAFAKSMNIPTLIVMEDGVRDDGIWDDFIVQYNTGLLKFTYEGTLEEQKQHKAVIDSWYNSVILK